MITRLKYYGSGHPSLLRTGPTRKLVTIAPNLSQHFSRAALETWSGVIMAGTVPVRYLLYLPRSGQSIPDVKTDAYPSGDPSVSQTRVGYINLYCCLGCWMVGRLLPAGLGERDGLIGALQVRGRWRTHLAGVQNIPAGTSRARMTTPVFSFQTSRIPCPVVPLDQKLLRGESCSRGG